MRAFVCRRYGGPEVLELADVPKPVPADHEVLVRIHATTVSSADWRVRTLEVPRGLGLFARLALGVTGPRQPILGTELSGTIESVGVSVSRFNVGDAVFAFPGGKMGCHAEYRVIGESGAIALKPANLSFEEAATLSFGGATALDFLRRGAVARGDEVLVIGASGAVGAALVQLARHRGARVTGVTSTGNMDLVAGVGAETVIDYTKEDITRRAERYDIIADTVGANSYARYGHLLKPNGRLMPIAGGLSDLVTSLLVPVAGTKKVIAGPASERPEYVQELADLAQAGAIRPVIDRRYEFAQLPEAHAYVATGRKRGSVVVRVLAMLVLSCALALSRAAAQAPPLEVGDRVRVTVPAVPLRGTQAIVSGLALRHAGGGGDRVPARSALRDPALALASVSVSHRRVQGSVGCGDQTI